MCRAIHRLLSEFGGCWITADSGIVEIYSLTFGTLLQGDQKAFLANIKGHATRMADVDFYKNSLFLNGADGARTFLKAQGFDVKTESVSDYLPKLRTVSEDEARMLAESYRKMEIWTMTVDSSADHQPAGEDVMNLPFRVESELKDGLFSVSIQGRLDTITAPELLKQFQEADGEISAIRADVSKMAYVSSAGLRVLLIMLKSLKNKDNFEITGISEDVMEILNVTGFADIFGL
jgi:anti-anti-sigma factor